MVSGVEEKKDKESGNMRQGPQGLGGGHVNPLPGTPVPPTLVATPFTGLC